MKNIILHLVILGLEISLSTARVYAQSNFTLEQPQGYGIATRFNNKNPFAEEIVETIVLNVISLFFLVGGIGTVVYFIWGAVDWILSGGDKEKIAGARKKMTHALVGLALLSLSFVIINWIGLIVGFNPLGIIQLRNLGDSSGTAVPQ